MPGSYTATVQCGVGRPPGAVIAAEAVVMAPAVVFVRAPANENGRGGATDDVTGTTGAMSRPLTKGRVPGRRDPSLSDLSIMRFSGVGTANGL